MQLFLNVCRILIAIAWTSCVGLPVILITYTTYPMALACAAIGRVDLQTRIIAWNAWVMGWVAQNLWAPLLLYICGVTVWTRQQQPIDWKRSYVVCANHASIFDILVLVRVLPLPIRFVAKRELTKWPFIGWSLRPSGQIIVDRKQRDHAIQSIHDAAHLPIGGQVIFFVEGTRSRTGKLLPFKRGAFHFSLDTRLPILPATVVGSYGALARLPWWRLHPGREIGVVFGIPIEVPGVDPSAATAAVEMLSASTREQIVAALAAAD